MAELYAPVPGFRFSGIAAGIKKQKPGAKPPLDLGLIVADEPVSSAAVFTTNRVKAAPVRIAASRLRNGACQAALVNSGNANAATGEVGRDAARSTTRALARLLGVPRTAVVPASTGVIGVPLPADQVEAALPELVRRSSEKGAQRFARAILTTDRGTKAARATFPAGKKLYSVLGIAKGAGMIHPNMATTLGFVVCDAPVAPADLRAALKRATEQTFNRITVDGDTSTNDMVLAMASGQGRPLRGKALRLFEERLQHVLWRLAMQIVADGEGAQHVAKIVVEAARTEKQALAIARTIATSQLVKTALHGEDPNWGRILGAFDPDLAQVRIGDVLVYRNGVTTMTPRVEKRAASVMRKKSYTITLRLQVGPARAHYWTCDLGHDYVSCNADYRS
jgi:glutamate N-acetyltransferase/amino-acid N-acetyltransferase